MGGTVTLRAPPMFFYGGCVYPVPPHVPAPMVWGFVNSFNSDPPNEIGTHSTSSTATHFIRKVVILELFLSNLRRNLFLIKFNGGYSNIACTPHAFPWGVHVPPVPPCSDAHACIVAHLLEGKTATSYVVVRYPADRKKSPRLR